MDLLDFEPQHLYFEEELSEQVESLMLQAASAYGEGKGELPLLKAFLLAPTSLTVMVGLYRFYYYQHRLQEAMDVAERACLTAASRIGFPDNWRMTNEIHLASAVVKSMGLVRFYLTGLKACGYLCLRLGRLDEGRERLIKVRELDEHDRLGAGALLQMFNQSWREANGSRTVDKQNEVMS